MNFLNFFFFFFFFVNFTQMKPSTDTFQGFWPDIKAGAFTEQLFSGTAILTENFRWLLLELQKFLNYNLEALETSLLSGKIRLTIDIFSNKQIDRKKQVLLVI